jgi:3-oxoacyl-[acyl-carrier protein] reductase
MKSLAGKVAVVTGGARGLGLEYALRLASLGADVAVCDKNLHSASEYEEESLRLVNGSVADTIARAGARHLVREVDVSRRVQVDAFIKEVRAEFGRIDVLVCNAGGGGNLGGSQASQLEEESTRATLDRNYMSTVFSATAVAPFMKAQRSGKIINIASFMGSMALGAGLGADYAVAKAAVSHYTRYLAQDLAEHGVTANAIAPGFIATGQFKTRLLAADPARHAEWLSSIPLKRFGEPGDCANLVAFLSTAASDYITGQVICIDGGLMRGAS